MRVLLIAVSIVLAACPKSSTVTGSEGPAGSTGAMGTAGSRGTAGPAGATGATGATGPEGQQGPPGQVTVLDGGTLQGPPGITGPTGATGSAGASAQVTTLATGDAACPTGGVRIAVGAVSTVVCNGPAGAAGAIGATGAAGPPGTAGTAGASATLSSLGTGNANCPSGGTQISIGATTTYACNGAPATGGTATYNGGVPPVSFSGYTQQTYNGNLGARSGANALCGVAYSGSHFCTDWETDEADVTPPPASGAWIDLGYDQTSTRIFHSTYSATDTSDCNGWTNGAAAPASGQTAGWTIGSQGAFESTFVSSTDSGCETARPLACCKGGTAVRFRGFTSSMGGNLGGRTGAQSVCSAAFSGSHFCTDWETDQANVPAPIPASGAWIDLGYDQTSTRIYHSTYSNTDTSNCNGWTTSAARPSTGQTAGWTLTSQGGFASTFVSSTDSGCEVPRPLACCDGYPPQ